MALVLVESPAVRPTRGSPDFSPFAAECTPIADGGGPVTCTNNNDTQGIIGFQCENGYFFLDIFPADDCQRAYRCGLSSTHDVHVISCAHRNCCFSRSLVQSAMPTERLLQRAGPVRLQGRLCGHERLLPPRHVHDFTLTKYKRDAEHYVQVWQSQWRKHEVQERARQI
jgi:hypothetical protein